MLAARESPSGPDHGTSLAELLALSSTSVNLAKDEAPTDRSEVFSMRKVRCVIKKFTSVCHTR